MCVLFKCLWRPKNLCPHLHIISNQLPQWLLLTFSTQVLSEILECYLSLLNHLTKHDKLSYKLHNAVNSEFWHMCIFLCSFKGWHLSNYFVPNKDNPWDEIEWRNFPGLPKSWHFWKIILWQRFMNFYLFFSCCAPGDRCDGGPGQNSLRSDAAVPIGRTNPHSLLQRRIWKTSLQVTT